MTSPHFVTSVAQPPIPFGAPPYPLPPFYGAQWPPQGPPNGTLGWNPSIRPPAYPPAYPMYYAPVRTVDYRALAENEPAAAWLKAATAVFNANGEPPNVASLRATNVLRLSGMRGTQIASAIESNPQATTSWQGFATAFLAAAGDDKQALATVRHRLASFQAPISAGAAANINAFKSVVNDLLAVSPTAAMEMAVGGADSTIARNIRRQYVMGHRSNPELFHELQKLDTQDKPLEILYSATVSHQSRKIEYEQWQFAPPPSTGSASVTADPLPTLNIAREPGPVIVDMRSAARAAPTGNYTTSGQFQPARPAQAFQRSFQLRNNATWRPRNYGQPTGPLQDPTILAAMVPATGANLTYAVNRYCTNCFVLGHFERDCTNANVPAQDDVRRWVRTFNHLPPNWSPSVSPTYALQPAAHSAMETEIRRRSLNNNRGGGNSNRGNWRGNQGNHGNQGNQGSCGQGQGRGGTPVNALLSLSEGIQALQGFFEGQEGNDGSDGFEGQEGFGYDNEMQDDDANYGSNSGISES